jgi:hypothetical protein
VDREIKFLGHWWEAVGFACNAMVWASKESLAPLPAPQEPTEEED